MSDWEFDLNEVGPEAEEATTRIEPGSPKLEHIIPFVVGAGVAVGILVLVM